jgi:hypothetical protein
VRQGGTGKQLGRPSNTNLREPAIGVLTSVVYAYGYKSHPAFSRREATTPHCDCFGFAEPEHLIAETGPVGLLSILALVKSRTGMFPAQEREANSPISAIGPRAKLRQRTAFPSSNVICRNRLSMPCTPGERFPTSGQKLAKTQGRATSVQGSASYSTRSMAFANIPARGGTTKVTAYRTNAALGPIKAISTGKR